MVFLVIHEVLYLNMKGPERPRFFIQYPVSQIVFLFGIISLETSHLLSIYYVYLHIYVKINVCFFVPYAFLSQYANSDKTLVRCCLHASKLYEKTSTTNTKSQAAH